jgi:hypothetical protein
MGRRRRGSGVSRDQILAQLHDRAQQALPVAERDAQILEVCVTKLGKDVEINSIVGEDLGVLAKPKILQPPMKRHRVGHESVQPAQIKITFYYRTPSVARTKS